MFPETYESDEDYEVNVAPESVDEDDEDSDWYSEDD
jgi:hypothetical protein